MMRKIALCLVFLVMLCVPTNAEKTCKQAFEIALDLFHSGEYYDAKLMFTKVYEECGRNYKNVDAMLQLCNHKLKEIDVVLYVDDSSKNIKRELKSLETMMTFDVKCYGAYYIEDLPDWCELISQERNYFEIACEPNASDTTRYGEFKVIGGGKIILITLVQEGTPRIVEEDTVVVVEDTAVVVIEQVDTVVYEPTPTIEIDPLEVSKMSIHATAGGVTEYIDVTCGKEWEIQYASGSMYIATKVGNRVKVRILPNKEYSTRSDYFYIRTVDEEESIKITLSQAAAEQETIAYMPTEVTTTSTTSTSTTLTSTSSSYAYMSAYDRYCAEQGSFEVTWFGSNFSIGTGFEYSISLLRLRWGWFQFSPLELTIAADFLNISGTSFMYAYQPTVNFVIPANERSSVYIGAGPSLGNYGGDIDDFSVWFKTEAGYRFHWGKNASSDVFVRYDGIVSVGVSIQCSSHN